MAGNCPDLVGYKGSQRREVSSSERRWGEQSIGQILGVPFSPMQEELNSISTIFFFLS